MCVYIYVYLICDYIDIHEDGIPRVITTDQGSEFNNQLNKRLMSVSTPD